MLEIGLADFFHDEIENVEINDIELKADMAFETYDLLNDLVQKFPEKSLNFVMGSDLIDEYRGWDYGERLKKDFEFVIVERVGFLDYDKGNMPDRSLVVDFAMKNEISSTLLRERVRGSFGKGSLGLLGLTTRGVIEFIKKNRIFLK